MARKEPTIPMFEECHGKDPGSTGSAAGPRFIAQGHVTSLRMCILDLLWWGTFLANCKLWVTETLSKIMSAVKRLPHTECCVIHFPTCTLDFFLSMDYLLLISLFCISIFWSPPSLRKTLIAAITLKNYSKKKTTELRMFSVYSYYSIIFITYLSCHIDRQALR